MKYIVYSVPTVFGAVLQACFQLVPYIVFLCQSEMAWDQSSRAPGCLKQLWILPMWWIKVFLKKIILFHKNLQALIKKWKCKAHSVSNHLQVKHNLCSLCLCHILKAPRWIGQGMISWTIDFSSGSWSVRIFLTIHLPCYLNLKSARKL